MAADFDVITIGDMCVDLIVDMGATMPRFGQVEQWVPDYFLEMGGSCCIFACQAAKLGLRTAILGRVGDDVYGQLVMRRLQESGVDTRFVSVDGSLKTGLGIALARPNGDRAILTYGGSLNAVYPSDITDQFLSSGRHLHYGSYYLQTNLHPVAASLIRRAKALGLSVSLDSNWDPGGGWDGGLHECLRQVDIFLPNEQEACAISGQNDVEQAVAALLQEVPVVAVKRGENGALVASGLERHPVPAQPVAHIVDTIGAGDSFDAGFLAGWLRGLPLRRCAEIGNACGRASTQARGGIIGQPRLADLAELFSSGPE
jgi:sugar/nucleoside kinase (ribokinase family)